MKRLVIFFKIWMLQKLPSSMEDLTVHGAMIWDFMESYAKVKIRKFENIDILLERGCIIVQRILNLDGKEIENENFIHRLIFEVGKWHTPLLIGLTIFSNMQKQSLKKFENYTRYGTIFIKGTILRKVGMACLVVLPCPSPSHHYGPQM